MYRCWLNVFLSSATGNVRYKAYILLGIGGKGLGVGWRLRDYTKQLLAVIDKVGAQIRKSVYQ